MSTRRSTARILVAVVWFTVIPCGRVFAQSASAPSPTLSPIAPLRALVGDSVRLSLIVNDLPPTSTVDFRLERHPESARVDRGVLRWRPLRADAGSTYSIGIVVVVDGQPVTRGTAEITVADAHRAPVMRQLTDRVIPPGDSLTLAIDATDPDGDVLTYAVSNLTDPSMAPRVDRLTGLLRWVAPAGPTNRVYVWRVSANDGDGEGVSSEMRVAVRSQNVAPVCGPMRSYKRDEGDAVEIALEADDANGDSLAYQPLMALPNGEQRGRAYQWRIPYAFVASTRQDSTVRFEWRAADPTGAVTGAPCVALVTVFRSIPDAPFRARQQQHRQLIGDVRSEIVALGSRERATRDSVASVTGKKRVVKRASLLSALVGGLLQIASSEDTRRIAAGVSATLTVGLSGWESTIDDGGPLAVRAESLAQQRSTLQRALSRFLRKYGESVTRDALLGASYDADHLELFDLHAASSRGGDGAAGGAAAALPPP